MEKGSRKRNSHRIFWIYFVNCSICKEPIQIVFGKKVQEHFIKNTQESDSKNNDPEFQWIPTLWNSGLFVMQNDF